MSGPQDHRDASIKRDFLRLPLGVIGYLETLNGRQRVEIVDLSQGGAYVVLLDPTKSGRYEVRDCVLSWMKFEAFGEVKRQEDGHFGIAFDTPLSARTIVETRKNASQSIRNDFLELKQHARLWARGIFSA